MQSSLIAKKKAVRRTAFYHQSHARLVNDQRAIKHFFSQLAHGFEGVKGQT